MKRLRLNNYVQIPLELKKLIKIAEQTLKQFPEFDIFLLQTLGWNEIENWSKRQKNFTCSNCWEFTDIVMDFAYNVAKQRLTINKAYAHLLNRIKHIKRYN